MARDGGQVDVRFSVANAEVVRQALAMLGKDGEKALRQFDAAAKPVPQSTRLIGQAIEGAKDQARAFASSLGPVGSGLAGMGVAGLVTAGALGAVVVALNHANNQVNQLADKAGRLRDFSETVDLSVTQVQALTIAAADVGVTGEKVEAGIGRMAVALEELRNGSGRAYDILRKINPELVDQLQRTRDTAQSVNLLAQAWERMDAAQRLQASRALFGRDLGMSRVISEIASAGGLGQLEARLSKSIVLTAEQAKKFDDLKDAADRLRTSSWERIWSIFAEPLLQSQMRSAQTLDSISQRLKEISELSFSDKLITVLGLLFTPAGTIAGLALRGAPPAAGDNFATRFATGTADVPLPSARPSDLNERSLQAQLASMRERNALLGSAITPAEQLKQKMLELAVATENDARLRDAANRGLAAFTEQQRAAAVAVRTKLGIVGEEEIITTRITELQRMRAHGHIRSDEEMARAEELVRREIKETMDALEVRLSRFPALTRFIQEGSDVARQFDAVAVSGINNVTSALTDIATGTRNAKDAFKDLAMQVTRSIVEMTLRMTIAIPIARALQAALGSFIPGGGGGGLSLGAADGPVANAMGNVFSGGRMIAFAHGGIVNRPTLFPFAQGIGLMGERGPEAIMPLRRTSRGDLGVVASGGGPVINFNVEDRVGVDMRSKRQKRNSDGSFDVDLLLEQKVTKTISSGAADRAMRRHGNVPATLRR